MAKGRHEERKRALEERKSVDSRRLDFPQHLVRQRNSDQMGAPVRIIGLVESSAGPVQTFRDFLPVGQIETGSDDSLDDIIRRDCDGSSPQCLRLLSDEWSFTEIETHARALEGHAFSGRKHRTILEIVLMVVYDFEASLDWYYPALSAESKADFWCSWQLWRCIAIFCETIGYSTVGRNLSRNAMLEANRVRDFLYKQLTAYVHKIRPCKTSSVADRSVTKDQQERIAEVERELERNTEVHEHARGQSKFGKSQAAAQPSCDLTIDSETPNLERSVATQAAQAPPADPISTTTQSPSSSGRIAKVMRAAAVAKLIKELNQLRPQMFEDESEYNQLRSQNAGFLTFKIAEQRPDLKEKILSIQSSTRHIRLAQELAGAHCGRTLSTIQDDWKHCKPVEFKRQT